MRWLVTGASGMLGQDLMTMLRGRGVDAVAADRDELDITSTFAVAEGIRGYDVVVNCAAYTAVDLAESAEADAFTTNGLGAAFLARACADAGIRLVHVSTDYVFPGDATAPYEAHDAPGPQSAYGRTKLAGEWGVGASRGDHLIVRTAWLYGAHGVCFPRTITALVADRGAISVVADQVGQPTWTVDVADLIVRLVEQGAPSGVYHATSSGETTWFDFARAAVAAAGLDPEAVSPTTSSEFVRPAPRPAYSVLGHASLRAAGVEPIGAWGDRWAQAAPVVLGREP